MWLLKLIFIVELFVLIENAVGHPNPWCDKKYDCVSKRTGRMCKHTMCQYETHGPECGSWEHHLTDEEKALILDMHNKIRAKVANGQMDKQPGATNMMRMEWDDDAEKIAQRWASQCKIETHDDCHDSLTGEKTGQNIAYKNYGRSWGSADSNRIPDLKSMFHDQWINNEVVNMYPGYVSSYPMNPPRTVGHYTQAVWAGTTRLGCGLAHSLAREDDMLMWDYKFVCNYIAAGNMIGAPVYLQGVEPATQCPSGAGPSVKYPGLCEYNKKYHDYSDKLVDSPTDNEGNPQQAPTQQAPPSRMKPGVKLHPLHKPTVYGPGKDQAKISPKPSLEKQPNRINSKPIPQPSYSISSYFPSFDWANLPIIGRFFSSTPPQPTTVNNPSNTPRPKQNTQAKPQIKPIPVSTLPVNENKQTPRDELTDRYIVHDRIQPTGDPFEAMRKSQEDLHRTVQAEHANMIRRFEGMPGMPSLILTPPTRTISPYSQQGWVFGGSQDDDFATGSETPFQTARPIQKITFRNGGVQF